MRRFSLLSLAVFVACSQEPPAPPDPLAEHAVAAARCTACHAATGATAERLRPSPAPSLDVALPGGWLERYLPKHFAKDADEARDLAHFLRSRTGAVELTAGAVGDAELDRGGRGFLEWGCVACHDAGGIGDFAAKTDLARATAFLRDPRAVRADLRAHDFGLDAAEARSLAAWLLREQRVESTDAPPTSGVAWECFEMQISKPDLPELEGRVPTATGRADRIDVTPRTREDNFALRFTGSMLIAAAGRWSFTIGSDDASWLWIDGEQLIANAAIAPYRRRSESIELAAGWHEFVVVFTEAGGGQQLDLLWKAPGGELEAIPPTALASRTAALVPPGADDAVDPARVARGATAFAARRCGACHVGDGWPAAPSAAPWSNVARRDAACPRVAVPPAARPALVAEFAGERTMAAELAFRMARDGCASCHVRDGSSGMRPAAREHLVEVEDLGEEGRVPPELSRVGHRLQRPWVEAVLADGRRARPYMRVRMPRVSADDAKEYAGLFELADAVAGDDVEPAFEASAAAEGRRIAGSGGFACIACHRVAGRPSLGPQGMDLAMQHERVKPGWFRKWLLQPATLRPGTRMPSFWPAKDAAAIAQVDAVRIWSKLGNAMPLPAGVVTSGTAYVLEADGDRPRLHGAFLKDLSARCISVGTPERTHYAYDLAHQRLAWLWRGAFLDAEGTWSGRAGQLLTPLGEDWVTLPEGCPFSVVGGDATPRMLGWTLDTAGYPTWRIGLGDVVVEDFPRPRWSENGSELVRTIRARGGAVHMSLPALDGPVGTFVDGKRVGEVNVPDGGSVEVLFRW